jgi:hypothetical protein
MMNWQQFITDNADRYLEARQWRDAGLSWEQVRDTWPVGNDLLWAAEQMGLIDHDTAVKIACACVTHALPLAPDIEAVTDAVWAGDMMTAWHEMEATEAITAVPDVMPDPDSTLPEPEYTVDPAAMKARFAAKRLLSDDMPNACYHAVQAPTQDARAAWAQALRDVALSQGVEPDENGNIQIDDRLLKPIDRAMLKELQSAIPRVEALGHKLQADFVRWILGGLE